MIVCLCRCNSKQPAAFHNRRQLVSLLLWSWTCSSSFCVITVSTVQLQTVQFVQYLYRKCAVLLCSWTCSSSFCVITVSTVQLQTVQFVQYFYSTCAVLLCSWTWHALCLSVSSNRQQYTFTVCLVVFRKTATKMCLLVPLYISLLPSSCNNWRNSESIFMKYYNFHIS